MLRVGLTGGLASGKSFVGRALEELGCLWIQADELGHRVLRPDGKAYAAVVAEFGGDILKEDGTIDRPRLGCLAFSDPERLAALNSMVHPAVICLEEELIADFAARAPHGITVVEAAILVETGGHRRFDKLIVTSCSREQQLERAVSRMGMTREQALARIARQLPVADKLKVADYVIDTSGEESRTLEQVRKVYESLRSIAS